MKFDVGVRHVVTVRQAIQYSNKTEDFYQERSKEHQPEATYLDLA